MTLLVPFHTFSGYSKTQVLAIAPICIQEHIIKETVSYCIENEHVKSWSHSVALSKELLNEQPIW